MRRGGDLKTGALLALAVLGSIALAEPDAFAGEADTVAADTLFRAGREALARGDLAVACARLSESYRLDPAVGTMLNLADCEERSGRLAAALTHFTEVRDALAPNDYRAPVVERRIAGLERRVPRLTVVATSALPPAARIECDGTSLGLGALGVGFPVDPGPHVCTLRVQGRADTRVNVTLGEGQRASVALEQGPEIAPAAPTPAAVSTPARSSRLEARSAPPAPSSENRTVAYVLGGVGVAGIAVGAVTGIAALNAGEAYRAHCAPACDPTGVDAASTGRTMVVASPVAFAIGAASLGGAVVLFVLGGRSKKSTSLRLAPVLAPGITVETAF